jgi:hypothetical protein
MNRLALGLLLVGAWLLLAAGRPAAARADAPPADTPADTLRVLVINQDTPDWPAVGERRGALVESLFRHFTPNVMRVSQAEYAAGTALTFSHVVVAGNDALRPLPDALLADLVDLTRARRPVLWLGYGLIRLPLDTEQALGFSPGYWTDQSLPTAVEYHGQRYAAAPADYSRVRLASSTADVLATYTGEYGSVPYLVRGGSFWYLNGLPAVSGGAAAPGPVADAPTLILADALHDFLGAGAAGPLQAVIWLADASVRLDPARLIEAADYLSRERVPFALALTPSERLPNGRALGLAERPALVRALRHAQAHGATIVLRGTAYGQGDAALRGVDLATPAPWSDKGPDAAETESDIRELRNLSLEPRLWQPPDWAPPPAARPPDRYFSHASGSAGPDLWLPYAVLPDGDGRTLLPSPGAPEPPWAGPGRRAVEAQLDGARRLRIVRDGLAVGRHSLADAPLSELEALVGGLRAEGFVFADLRALPAEVHDDYRPDVRARLAAWLAVDKRLLPGELDQRMAGQFAWWPAARRLPWAPVLLVGAVGVFLLRLREQWRPAAAEALSQVDPVRVAGPGALPRRRRPRLGRRAAGWALLAGVVAFAAAGAWAASRSPSFPGGHGPIAWSDFPWEVAYNGYGSVRAEGDGSLVLEPLPARRPGETHAALVLAGDRSWRDYSFSVRMSTRAQLRANTPPNPWETGWLYFRYESAQRSYYLAHKTNGLELGKLAASAVGGQVFLATTPGPPAELGRWYDYRVDVSGATIRVYVDDRLALTYTDPDPITSGGVGLYTEDARVAFQGPAVVLGDASRPASSPAAVPAASGRPWRTVFEGDFSGAQPGWPDDPQGVSWLAEGTLHLWARVPSRFVAVGAPAPGGAPGGAFRDAPTFRDLEVSATFRKVGGPSGGGYGLIVRDQGPWPRDGVSQGGRYYVLEVGDRGEVGVWRREETRWVDLLPWTLSSAVRPGEAPNDLIARAVGRRLTFVVNGTEVASLEDAALGTGTVGVFVGGDHNEVALDRYALRVPAAEAP